MKKAFLLRGFSLDTSSADPDYEEVRDAISISGYEVLAFPETWNNKTVDEYINKFISFYEKNKGKNNIIIGHSFGAMIALIVAPRTRPDLLVLCSMSGYFKEDLAKHNNSHAMYNLIGQKRLTELSAISAIKCSNEIRDANIPTVMIYGEKEKSLYPILYNSIQRTAKIINTTKIFVVPDSDHKMHNNINYIDILSQQIRISA